MGDPEKPNYLPNLDHPVVSGIIQKLGDRDMVFVDEAELQPGEELVERRAKVAVAFAECGYLSHLAETNPEILYRAIGAGINKAVQLAREGQ